MLFHSVLCRALVVGSLSLIGVCAFSKVGVDNGSSNGPVTFTFKSILTSAVVICTIQALCERNIVSYVLELLCYSQDSPVEKVTNLSVILENLRNNNVYAFICLYVYMLFSVCEERHLQKVS